MLYKFSLEPDDVTNGIDTAKSFEATGMDTAKTFKATSMIDALQQASNYWYKGKKVDTFHKGKNNLITMRVPSLCGAKFGNVLGRLINDGTKTSAQNS